MSAERRLTADDFPTGTLLVFTERHATPLIMSGEWRPADGHRIRRREDPPLYDLLRPEFRRKWRRWIVHVPDLRTTTLAAGAEPMTTCIRTSLTARRPGTVT